MFCDVIGREDEKFNTIAQEKKLLKPSAYSMLCMSHNAFDQSRTLHVFNTVVYQCHLSESFCCDWTVLLSI